MWLIRKGFPTIIFSFFSFTALHAQYKTYKRGYIVITPNDTLRGYIREKPDYELLESLDFSPDASYANNKIYSKKDLNGFGFDNGRLFQKIISTKITGKDTMVRRIKEAAIYAEIKVIDHLIITRDSYYSFADNGLI